MRWPVIAVSGWPRARDLDSPRPPPSRIPPTQVQRSADPDASDSFGGRALALASPDTLGVSRALAWIGLASQPPDSNDFVPLFPWFALPLVGIAAARLARGLTGLSWFEAAAGRVRTLDGVAWAGRHSLVIYLAHQPVLLSLLYALMLLR